MSTKVSLKTLIGLQDITDKGTHEWTRMLLTMHLQAAHRILLLQSRQATKYAITHYIAKKG